MRAPLQRCSVATMPYRIVERNGQYCVIRTTDGSSTCYASRSMAESLMAALYANEPGTMHAANLPQCTCQHDDVEPMAFAAAAVEPFDAAYPTPSYPPRDWFDEPTWIEPGQGLTVTESGRVGGYFYDKGACLVHMHGACPRPSPTGYAAFHQQHVVLADGETLQVGVIGNVNGHAHPVKTTADTAALHYSDPDSQFIACRAGDNEHGGWFAGALVPGLTYGDVALARRCALSGDWRVMPPSWWSAHNVQASVVADCESYDCIGPTFVTRPGLPLVRRYARTAAAIARWMPDEEGDIVKVTIEGEPGAVTEVATALQAANPPPAADGGPPADGGQPPAGDMETRMAQMESDVAELKDVVSQIVDAIQQSTQQQAAAVSASAKPLPARPKVDPGQMVVNDFVENVKVSVPS